VPEKKNAGAARWWESPHSLKSLMKVWLIDVGLSSIDMHNNDVGQESAQNL